MVAHEGTRWSLTDCPSVVLMQEVEIADEFIFDQHLAAAGFRVLPGS
jgi:predicted nucleic acid-binding protein